MRNSKLSTVAGVAACLLGGCVTPPQTPPDGDIIEAVTGPSGELIAIDQNGNEVDSPEALALLELVRAARGEGPSLNDNEIWHTDTEGNLTHIQSGGICPKAWGDFSRTGSPIFKQDGTDVGCNLQSEELQASFTFYFYRNSQSTEEDLQGVMDTIKLRVPNSKEYQPTLFPLANGDYSIGMIESAASNGISLHNGVLIAKDSGWQIKLRVTYPAGRAFEMEPIAVTMLTAQMDQVNEAGFTPIREEQPGDELKTES